MFLVLQVVLTVSQTVWARDATEALENEGDRLEAMKEFELQNIAVSHISFLLVEIHTVIIYPHGLNSLPSAKAFMKNEMQYILI